LASAACAARSALAVASVLCALALPRPERSFEACAWPVEHRAEGAHSSAVRCAADASAPALRGPARRLFGLPLDPNLADAATLETLPGIGPVRAAAILRARDERRFERLEDLLRVPGVGPVTLSRIAPLLAVDAGLRARLQENR